VNARIRALRLPFVGASVLPYVSGSLSVDASFRLPPFLLGLVAVVATHLAANLVNDHADSASGVDWADRTRYPFFGGSKLIQDGVLSPRWFLASAVGFSAVALIATVGLGAFLGRLDAVLFSVAILFLAWSYSHGPLRLAYRGWGEEVIFLLFGPATVVGGAFCQLGHLPGASIFVLSVPFGLLTTAILVANEVPDADADAQGGKRNWVHRLGRQRAYLAFAGLVSGAYVLIVGLVFAGVLGVLALGSLAAVPLGWLATGILRKRYDDKHALVSSSRCAIVLHAFVSLFLILDLWL